MAQEIKEEVKEEMQEIREAFITKKAYPLLWVGEDQISITRLARLIIVRPSWYRDEEDPSKLAFEMPVVKTVGYITHGEIPIQPGPKYILAGGFDPKLIILNSILRVKRYETEHIEPYITDNEELYFEIARGIKDESNAVLFTKPKFSEEFEEFKLEEGKSIIVKNYPDTFKISSKQGQLFIQVIRKDC